MRTGLRSTPRWEQISSARLGCALPPKMTISASIALLTVLRRGRRRTAHRRKPQLLPYLLLDGPRGWRRVHGDHALLTAKHVNGRLGLLMEVPQPDGERLLDVIGPAAGHPRADLIVWHVEVNHRVHIVVLHEELRLRDRAREPVDDKPEVPVMLSQPPMDHRLHQVVAYQLAGRQAPPDLGAHLRVVGHLPPEDIPHADVREVKVSGQQLALRPLAAPLDAHNHVLAHANTLAYATARPCLAIGFTSPPVSPMNHLKQTHNGPAEPMRERRPALAAH